MAVEAIIFCVPRDRAPVKPVGRFGRVIRQNACFGTRRCLLGFHCSPPKSPKPQFGGTFNAFPMENINTNNFWAVSPIIMKFGMQSLILTPKSVVCSNIKKLISKMAADTIILFVPRDSALVKPVHRFWRVIHQNACFGTWSSCLLGFKKIKISVFTPKIAKNPNFGALSMHFLRKT